MIVTEDMKVKDALKINEHMLDAFVWLGPEFERLRKPAVRRLMANRVSVSQAARIAGLPLAEALYVLNLAAGEDEAVLSAELSLLPQRAFECRAENPPRKPRELVGLSDEDSRVVFVDAAALAECDRDPQSAVMRGLMELDERHDVLLVRHRYDPIPLRDLFAARGFASWAEERRPHEWYVYFYRPSAGAAAVAQPLTVARFVRAVAAGA
jgi:PAS domain-containing protein